MEWKLKDLTVDGKGSYGIGAPAVPYQEDKLTYLRITDINDDGSLNFSDLKSVDAEDAEKYILKENDIVFARTGNSTGRSYFYEKQHGTFVYAGFLIKFSLDPNKVNPRILKYYTHSKPYFDWVNSFDTGATRGNINAKTYGDMEIELPSRKVQDKIVSILSSLDRKIELNNKINDDLEEMAQAIFKNWFVDFEPFKDGKFVDSELGMIPEGWKVGTLGDFCKCLLGGTPSRSKEEYWNGDVNWINSGEINKFRILEASEKITELGLSKSATKLLPKKTTVLAITGATLGQVSLLEIDTCTNQSVIGVLENAEVPYEYIYPFIKDRIEMLIQHQTGGAQQHINKDNVESLIFLLPAINVLEDYISLVSPMYKRIESQCFENLYLSTLRDTLLPRLMSGELEVPE
ncbi:restriction endonuclease subunit S [Prevotella copri]|uniref:Restriction endonuclease subunit S n=1 Tax=Segatella copri TaxID=165179 RepID=A0AA91A0Q1_9BACT|nr:restriction endonuclease subunit S [Segatella copri]MQN91136.1 restriction endonuclease subunit S [Segatella copri]